jgi:hypothetical protein
VLIEELLQMSGQGGILFTERHQPRLAFLIRHVERLIQVGAYRLPLIRA